MKLEQSFPLPTLPSLGVQESQLPSPDGKEAIQGIVSAWLSAFAEHVQSPNVDALLSLLARDSYWRDILALTWNLRTFAGQDIIRQFLSDRLAAAKVHSVKQSYHDYVSLARPGPDLAWIQFLYTFEVGDVGLGSGVIRLIPVPRESGELDWKAHSILTHLDELKHFPERIGSFRQETTVEGWRWLEEQENATKRFETENPTVLIIGGAQAGLDVAARLKCLGVDYLVIEKGERIGGNWRSRYEALCLHDPVWYDHLPYLPFPPTWPVFTPAIKMANWLESYADALELRVWLSSTVTKAFRNEKTGLWNVTITRPDKPERIFQVKHVVFATGFGGVEKGNVPDVKGREVFKGQVLHSLEHKKAMDHAGKKVIVVGSCTSAHDICSDFAKHGIDVTMYQRGSTHVISTRAMMEVVMKGLYVEGGPPTELADRINASFPNILMVQIGRRQVEAMKVIDHDLLEGLHKRGFATNDGDLGSGFLISAWNRLGGYYLDTGGSGRIIDGQIKLKHGSQIERFTENGLRFEDGEEIQADVVVFATGLGGTRDAIKKICGEDILPKISEVFGLDDEGEIRGVYKDMGIPGLWVMMGNLALCRFYSKHLALQIKAMEEGIFGPRYGH